MSALSHLLENNRAWAAGCRTADAAFFERLVAQQAASWRRSTPTMHAGAGSAS